MDEDSLRTNARFELGRVCGGYGFEREHRKTYSDDSVYNLLFMAKTSTTNVGERESSTTKMRVLKRN